MFCPSSGVRRNSRDLFCACEWVSAGPPLGAVVSLDVLVGSIITGCPFPRWDDAFCREVISSRVETTKTLAKAIADAERPPHAWVLVTGVGIGWAQSRHDSR